MAAWLPPEVLLNVASRVTDISVLLAMRLVCRDWALVVKTTLESWACLSLHEGSMDTFDNQFRHRKTRHPIINAAIIVPDRNYWHVEDDSGKSTIDHSVYELVQRLQGEIDKIHRLPHLTRLAFHIRPPTFYMNNPVCSPEMKEIAVESWLAALVNSFRRMAKKLLVNRSLKELSVQGIPISQRAPHLSGWTYGPISLHKLIQGLRLTSLELGLVSNTVWQPQYRPTYYFINDDHPFLWALGASASLKRLSISCWGFYMKNITGNFWVSTSLPVLQTLILRGCAFTSDKQLEWLLRHRQLRSLTLDDCTIIYKLALRARNPIKEGCDSVYMCVERNTAVQVYETRWSKYFYRIKESLHLRHFAFGSSRVRQPGEEGPVFDSELYVGPALRQPSAPFLFGLFRDRYLYMRDADPDCGWVLRTPSDKMKMPIWLRQANREDRDALRILLKHLRLKVDENATSNHAGYVERLIGRVKPEPEEDIQMQDIDTGLYC